MPDRNRVWLAKRHLSALLVPLYLGVWAILTAARTRSLPGIRVRTAAFASSRRMRR